jgi:hypothetical protein
MLGSLSFLLVIYYTHAAKRRLAKRDEEWDEKLLQMSKVKGIYSNRSE